MTSNLTDALVLCTERLESLLSREFGGKGKDLAERAAVADIPEDLRALLADIARQGPEDDVAELIFRCGQAYEKLDMLAKQRLAESLTPVLEDGMPFPAEAVNIDAISQFAQARDRFMKKVADATLKFLLITVLLLVLGLLLGII